MLVREDLYARFAEQVRRVPSHPCLLWDDEVRSYSDIGDASDSLVARLSAAGMGPGDKIAVLSPNSHLCVIAMLAIQQLRSVWLPINFRDSTSSLGTVLRRFECDAVLVHPEAARAIDELRSQVPTMRLVHRLDDPGELTPAPRASPPDPEDLDLAAIFTTGGTTGLPKGVAFTHNRLLAIADNYAHMQSRPGQIYLAAAPLTHVGGRICLSVLAAGGSVVVLPQFDPLGVLAAIEKYKVSDVTLTSTMLYRLLDVPDSDQYDTSSLRRLGYGASPTVVGRIRQALERFGPVLSSGYGQTEAPMFITRFTSEDHYVDGVPAPDERLRTVGRPTEASEVRILGDDDTEVPVGDVGEIVVRGDFTMSGYYRDPGATAARQVIGFQRTDDLGHFDKDGFLTIDGRRSDLIITGGFNVYPAEVEQAVAAIPGVREVAVIGLPDDDWGEAVTAVVTLHSGATLNLEQMRAAVREQLGGVKTPKALYVIDEFPRSDAGKVLKRVLVSTVGNPP